MEKPFITHTETTTSVTCRDMNGNQLYHTTLIGDSETKAYRDLITNLIAQHPQPIIIKSNTTKIITYRTENGHVLHTGYFYVEKN